MIVYPGSGVAFCGRRWGKTLAGVERILRFASLDPGMYWWIGLSWRSASMKRAWRLLKYFARIIWRATGLKFDRAIREQEKEIHLPNGATIWLRTAENPESLAGEGIKGAVIDEFPLMPEVVWTEYLEATLLDFEGWALFIGVPKGNNWGARLWRQAAGRAGWKQWHFTTYDNPFMPVAKIEEIKANTPADIFSQEYMAEVLEGAGQVFRNIRPCVDKSLNKARPNGRAAYGGLDWAQQNDYTVIAVVDAEGRVVDLDRFNQIGWQVQYDRVATMTGRWSLTGGLAELNSMGSPNLEQLLANGLRQWEGFTTTSESKAQIVQALALAFERKEIAIPNNPVLIAELEAFAQERLPSGRWRYGAPDGMHDDTVIALALAWEAHLRMIPTPFEIFEIGV